MNTRTVNTPKKNNLSRSGVRLRSRSSSPPPPRPRAIEGGVERRRALFATAIAVVLSALVACAVSTALARLLVL